jgi:4-amino-4-deoxy-L-arabinose transferase-like glycosyltransferase
MLDTGEWGLPVLFDGRADLQKPPGYYWAVAAVGWVNGGTVTEWVARLPAALAGLLCVLLVYSFLRSEGRPTAAVVAALVLATANHFTGISRTARIDVPLACAVTAALLAFYRGCSLGRAGGVSPPSKPRSPQHANPNSGGLRPLLARPVWHLLAALAAAAAVLLKGPVALALIGPAAFAWLLVERPRVPPTSWFLIPVVVAAVALPWFVWANYATNGEFLRVFFWHHTVARYAGSSPQLATYPWWYYLPRFAVDFLPWTPALAGLAFWAVRSGRWRADPVFRFALVTCAVMFAVLSTARFKRADYLLPLYPFAAIAAGCAAEAWLAARKDPHSVRRAKWVFGGTLAAVAVGWVVMTTVVEAKEQAREEKRRFAAVIREHAPAPHTILQFRMESHLLSYHLGRPVHTLVEWGELDELLAAPGPHFVVMPPEYVHAAGEIATSRKLVVVTRLEDHTAGKPPRPLVFLRTADSGPVTP